MQESVVEPPIKSYEICSLAMVRRVAAMLDLDTNVFSNGDVLPRGWHFFMLAGETRKSALRQDGFPGLGVPIPDLGLPRLLLGGRTVSYNGDIKIGSEVERTSFVKNITEKTTNSGRMAIVTIQHELRPFSESTPVIVETQTFILLSEKSVQTTSERTIAEPSHAKYQKQIVPDETLLFQYSALGFNSHKIHLDRDYAQNVEGLPDLVVNGGLATLLLTEFVRIDLGLEITEIKVKHIAPLFCGRKMTLNMEFSDIPNPFGTEGGDTNSQLKIFDDKNNVAVEMDVIY
jgi:3-methylfumaryl-CoA hydratase